MTGWHRLHFGRGRRAEDGPGSQQEGVFFLLFTPSRGWLVFCSVLFIDDKCSLSPRRSRSHMHVFIGRVKGEERDKKTGCNLLKSARQLRETSAGALAARVAWHVGRLRTPDLSRSQEPP